MQRFLLDANVLIPLEPTSPADLERDTPLAVEIVQRATALGFHLLVHPETIRELATDPSPARRTARQVLLAKYQELGDPPGIEHVEGVLGAVDPQSNDWADHLLLAALRADAVHYLVTNDDQMHRKAHRLGVPSDRVLTIADARALLGTLVSSPQPPPPQVTTQALHSLRRADPIFRSLHDDYPGFDRWFRGVSQEGRQAWVIESPEGEYAGICIWKSEDDEFRLGGKVMKLSTFKVSEEHRGRRYGELLLKTAFNDLHANRYDYVWLTVFERHAALITMLEDFGFERLQDETPLGELVMVKHLTPTDGATRDHFAYHRHFGPPAVDPSLDGGVYVIPIQPRYHGARSRRCRAERRSCFTARTIGKRLPPSALSSNLCALTIPRTSLRSQANGRCIATKRSRRWHTGPCSPSCFVRIGSSIHHGSCTTCTQQAS